MNTMIGPSIISMVSIVLVVASSVHSAAARGPRVTPDHHEGGGVLGLTLVPATGPVQPNDPDLAFLFSDIDQLGKNNKPASASKTAAGNSATRPVAAVTESQAVARMQQLNRQEDLRVAARNTPMPAVAAAPR